MGEQMELSGELVLGTGLWKPPGWGWGCRQKMILAGRKGLGWGRGEQEG